MTAVPRLELRGIGKRYPGVVANDGIALAVEPGEIHAVLGENGAGKSTLMKIIYGIVRPDEGEMLWDGEALPEHGPAQARAIGIEMVHQHFALFETVSVVENIALVAGGGFDLKALAERVREVSARYGLPVDPKRIVHHLSVGERQRVEIVRCLLQRPKLLILDEPTSVLAPPAVARLFETLRQIAAEGCSILYISHKLHEVQELCDRATVLRDGRVVGTVDPKMASEAEMALAMVGHAPPAIHQDPGRVAAAPLLAVRGLSGPATDPFGVDLAEIGLEVHAGEVVGIAGISGNGQSELVALLSGERPATAADMIALDGRPIGRLGPGARRALGLAYVPEERLGRGTVPAHSLAENALLTGHRLGLVGGGFVRWRRAHGLARGVIDGFDVKATGTAATARSLSGGNLQKFIMGREIALKPRLLLVAQPTWGVDVGASAFIRQQLIDLSRAGAAVLVISEELDELFEICDRLHVMRGGRLSPSLARAEATPERVGLLMTTQREAAVAP